MKNLELRKKSKFLQSLRWPVSVGGGIAVGLILGLLLHSDGNKAFFVAITVTIGLILGVIAGFILPENTKIS
ncbi:MAG: hypothetical protein IKN54_03435 [Lachnospiraceae bacterium]|nr:hypothetical protein [Lachnospiraceae bacterium]